VWVLTYSFINMVCYFGSSLVGWKSQCYL